jgi:hypothetical protein
MNEPDTPAGVRAYSFACLAALALMVVALALRRPDPWVLFPAALGLLALLFRWRAGPLLVLLAVMLLLWTWWLGTNPGSLLLSLIGSLVGWVWRVWRVGNWWWHVRLPRTWLRSRGPLPVSDSLLALSLLGYAAAHYRLQGLLVRLFPPEPRRRGAAAGQRHEEAPRRSPGSVTGREVVVLLLALAACGGLAALFWAWLQDQHAEDSPIGPSAWQGILVLWLLGGGVLVAAALLRYLALRRMTPPEAALYLQDVLWHETRREQRRLNRWLAWAWLRRRRREPRESS